jgi:hypothetical protein
MSKHTTSSPGAHLVVNAGRFVQEDGVGASSSSRLALSHSLRGGALWTRCAGTQASAHCPPAMARQLSRCTRLEGNEQVTHFHVLSPCRHPHQLHVLLLTQARQPIRAVAQDVSEQLSAGRQSVGGAVSQQVVAETPPKGGGFGQTPWAAGCCGLTLTAGGRRAARHTPPHSPPRRGRRLRRQSRPQALETAGRAPVWPAGGPGDANAAACCTRCAEAKVRREYEARATGGRRQTGDRQHVGDS